MDGYVLSTDLLPTILDRYGIAIPDGVDGQAITATESAADVAAIADREARLGEISSRRWEVLAVNLLIWLAVGLLLTLWRHGLAGPLLATLATAMAFVPAILMLAAALAPSELVERLMVGVGAPLVAALAIASLRSRLGRRAAYGAFALAAAISVGATAADVIVGSPLTSLSLLGPNPGLGVRFFGIGNELEAAIGAMLLLAVGAAVTAADPPIRGGASRSPRRSPPSWRFLPSPPGASEPTSVRRSHSRPVPRRPWSSPCGSGSAGRRS